MRIFVTGGAGYIGSHCVRMLIEHGHEVAVFDNLSTGHREVVPPEAEFMRGDLMHLDQVESAIKVVRPDVVMHFAAKCVIPESMANPVYYWEQNVGGTINLLRAMTDVGVENLIFSSTVAVYGDPEEIPIRETTPINPISPYGTTKVAAENAIMDAAIPGKIRYMILRYFNVGGAGYGIGCMTEEETRLIPLALQTAVGERDSLEVFGTDYPTRDGSCVRDFIHVLDIAEAHIAAMDYIAERGGSEIINLGTSEGYTVLEIAEMVREITGIDYTINPVDRRDGDTATVIASNEKAERLLDWRPRRDLREIIASAWEWEKKRRR